MKESSGRIRAVVFDFDGVILESTEIKTRAFAALFSNHPDHVDEIVRFHLENEGKARYAKFEQIHREILGLPYTDADAARLGDSFARLVVDEVCRCEFVPGAEELLERLSRSYRLFVASGTPEDEMRKIVRARGLGSFFAAVYGSPASKAELLKKIAANEGAEPGCLLFVGDTRADYEGAVEAGVPFVARVASGTNGFPERGVVARVADLRELDEQWSAVELAACAWRP